MKDAPTPEIAWHGEDVSIGDVSGALSDIRRKAAQEDAGDEGVHARHQYERFSRIR